MRTDANRMPSFKCPLCGFELTEVKQDESEVLCKDTECWECEKSHKDCPKLKADEDESIWYKCEKCGSFGDDFPIVCHHPFRGDKSKPGESWSLSWIR